MGSAPGKYFCASDWLMTAAGGEFAVEYYLEMMRKRPMEFLHQKLVPVLFMV